MNDGICIHMPRCCVQLLHLEKRGTPLGMSLGDSSNQQGQNATMSKGEGAHFCAGLALARVRMALTHPTFWAALFWALLKF